MVERLYHCLMTEVFPAALRNDRALIEAINTFHGGVDFREGELHFTLPALFDFLVVQSPDWPTQTKIERRLDYLRFRKIIYKNPTNETLGKQGAAVEIARLMENHDHTVYRLVRIAPQN